MPAATKFLDIDQNTVYSLGFPLGFVGTTEVRRALAIGLALAAGLALPLAVALPLALPLR